MNLLRPVVAMFLARYVLLRQRKTDPSVSRIIPKTIVNNILKTAGYFHFIYYIGITIIFIKIKPQILQAPNYSVYLPKQT